MTKKYTRVLICFVICATIAAALAPHPSVSAYEHPTGLWKHFDRWQTALETKDYAEILDLAPTIEALYTGEELCEDNCSILSILCENAARGAELKGDLDSAIAWLKKQLVYDKYLDEHGKDYYDRITLATAYLNQLDEPAEIYALTSNPADVPYFGAVGEPKTGVLKGSSAPGTNASGVGTGANTDSAVLIYVEFEPGSEHDIAYWLDYFKNNSDACERAMGGSAVIELAWNFPLESNQLQPIIDGSCDQYIIDGVKALAGLETTVLLRIGAEMNAWTELPAADKYIEAFRRIAGYAHQYAKNTAVVFSPNDVSSWGKSVKEYYPGDAYVDWVGVSTYFADNPSRGSYLNDAFYNYADYSGNHLARIRTLVDSFPNKPIMISECGFTTNNAASSVDRLTKFYAFLSMRYPQVKAVLYFDMNVSGKPQRYGLSDNTAIRDAYLKTTSSDVYLKSVGGDAKGYTRLTTLDEQAATLEIATLALFPYANPAKCTYYLDGVKTATVSEAPYSYEINIAGLSQGVHTVKAVVTCGNASRTVERQFTVSAGNRVTGGATAAKPVTTNPTAATVFINGKSVAFDAYNINDNNYFKLRDLAFSLSGTAKQFDVEWDAAANAIKLVSGRPYSAVGGEMSGGGSSAVTPSPTSSKILLDGGEISLVAYNISGNNYFKLRDVMQIFDIGVEWDGAANAIRIDTAKSYVPG